MKNIARRYNVGLDIHEIDFYGNIMTKQGQEITEGPVKYSEPGIQNFLGFLPSTEIIIAIEACGISRAVYKLLTNMGYEVVVANPKKTHEIACNKKTDKVDARTLANLLRTGYLPTIYMPDDDVLKLRDIARHRVRLVRTRTRLKLMIRSHLVSIGKDPPGNWNKKTIEELKEIDPMIANFIEIIKTTNEQIREVEYKIKRTAHNKYLVKLLMTIPGIGEFSAILILGEIGDIKRFDNPKSLVNYSGLCPGVSQSGKKSRDTINNENNKWLKWIMTECGGRAAMLNKIYMKHYMKVKKRKGFKVARRSVARKMLTDIWHILTKEEPFNKSES
jgi:transposase